MKTFIIILVLLFTSANSCETRSQKQQAMVEDAKSETVVRENLKTFVDSCWNGGNNELLSAISTEDFTRYLNGVKVASNQKEMQAHMNVFLTAFPDMELHLDHAYIENDKVFVHWTFTGTNTGIFGEGSGHRKESQHKWVVPSIL